MERTLQHSLQHSNDSLDLEHPSAKMSYSSGGFASIVINQPADLCFKILTNVNLWTEINVGVTQAISPQNISLQQGVQFRESTLSPIPGMKDWTNEWLIEEFNPGKSFVMTCLDHFSSSPIHTRLSYDFSAQTKDSTLFKRSIEASVDEHFLKHATQIEIEALYRFIGSQWEMARHLKHYVEAYTS